MSKDKTVVIVDDIVFTGGSLFYGGAMYQARGQRSTAVTHGVLTPGAQEKIENSPIKKLL